MNSPVVLQIENVIAMTDCGRPINIRNMIEYGEAFRDFDFAPAKYSILKRSSQGTKRGNISVNVFQSGKIVCTGAKSIDAAKECIGEILEKLRITGCTISVKLLVVTGVIREDIDIHSAIPKISERFPAFLDTTLFPGVYFKNDNILIQIYTSRTPVQLVCRGPDIESIRGIVSEIYQIIRGPK